MKLQKIIDGVNKLVGNSLSVKLRYQELWLYLDSAVDIINEFLKPQTPFQTISDLYDGLSVEEQSTFEYTEFEDTYIRLVLIYLTASLYLEEEDETEDQYQIYRSRAMDALNEWRKQDFSSYDISDNDYDYTRNHNIEAYAHNIGKSLQENKKLIALYEDKLLMLEQSNRNDTYTKNLIEQIKKVIKELKGE